MKLRPYQEAAIKSAFNTLAGEKSTLLVMATGTGKTVVFSDIIRRAMAAGRTWRTMILAHREELVHQAASTVARVCGCEVDIEMADSRSDEGIFNRAPVVCASVQTLNSGRGDRRRMHKYNPEQFGLLVVDEAHHAVARSYLNVMEWFGQNKSLRTVGVTATPDRSDEIALGEVFSSVCYEYGIADGITDGWLVPVKQRAVHVTGLDYSSVRTTAGDLNGADLDTVLQYEENLHGMVYPTIELVGDRRCLVFAASVAHAERVSEIINRHGHNAAWVCGATEKERRRTIFRDFAEGSIQYLVNVGVATEGWDDAALDRKGVQVISMMRPTKSRALYCQMVGRGTRPLPGTVDGHDDDSADWRRSAIANSAKPSVTILDYVGNAGRHKLVHCVDALAGDALPAVRERCEEEIMEAAIGEDIDVLERITQEELEERQRQEHARRRHITVRSTYTTEDIDPFSLVDLIPDRKQAGLRGRPASEKQISLLRRMKIGIPDNLTIREAGQLIDAGFGTPTPKQAWVLIKAGLDPADYNRKTASEVIDRIKKESKR